jgi:cytochrome c553
MKRNILSALLCILVFAGCNKKGDNENTTTSGPQEVKDGSKIAISNGMAVGDANSTTSQFMTYNIDGERVVRLSPTGEDNATTRQIGAVVTIKNQYDKLSADLLKKKLSPNFIRKCSACHDHYANGIIGPSLLTKSEAEIAKMIGEFKSNTKKNVLMVQLVKQMDDKEINALAKEIAEFNKEIRNKQ